MTNPLPEISVIVPVFNVAGYVGPCLDSLKAQTFTDFEVIVVDDGSTDTSADEARAAAGDDPRFSFLSQDNAGLSAARNTGLAEAAGVFVSFVDSDDRVAPDFLEKLHRAVTETEADWAACAVRMMLPDADPRDVSAIHGRPFPAGKGPWQVHRLTSWNDIIRFWPSAWNKLYRRTLIEGMRFVPGLYYEDHPWFQECAARANRLVYVPQPLYWQSQGRAGQITRDGSDKVFDQLRVLDECQRIIDGSDKDDPKQGFTRIASRLLFERANTVADPERRRRFAAACADYLSTRGLRYAPKWDPAIAHSWGRVMEHRLPLSVVIATDARGPGLGRTIHALARQSLRDFETLIVTVGSSETTRTAAFEAATRLPGASVLAGPSEPGRDGVAEARNRGLDAARGTYVVFLDAGDVPAPETLWLWTEAMLRSSAGLGLSQFRIGAATGPLHVGTHDGLSPMGEPLPAAKPPNDRWSHADQYRRLERLTQEPYRLTPARALRLHPLPSAKIFRRARLLESEVRFPPGPLSSWHMLLHAALVSRRMIAFDWPGLHIATAGPDRRFWHAPMPMSRLTSALDSMAPVLDPVLPMEEWRPILFARAVWEKINFGAFPDEEARGAFERAAAREARRYGAPALDRIDPYIGGRIRALFTTPAD